MTEREKGGEGRREDVRPWAIYPLVKKRRAETKGQNIVLLDDAFTSH